MIYASKALGLLGKRVPDLPFGYESPRPTCNAICNTNQLALPALQTPGLELAAHSTESEFLPQTWVNITPKYVHFLHKLQIENKQTKNHNIPQPIGDRLQRLHYLSGVDHERKIRSRRQRTDIGKYSFVNRTIRHWNQLPAEVLGILLCKPITFKKRVRKVIIELN